MAELELKSFLHLISLKILIAYGSNLGEDGDEGDAPGVLQRGVKMGGGDEEA